MVLERLIFKTRLEIILVRTPEDLCRCDALIIPGGGMSTLTLFPSPFIHVLYLESTAIALLARLSGVLEPLREFVKQKPVWGTCAGAILLSQAVKGAKKGGQELLGGMSITIARNGWGSQVLRTYFWWYFLLSNDKKTRSNLLKLNYMCPDFGILSSRIQDYSSVLQ